MFSADQIKKASQALSERYRKGQKPYLRSLVDRYAYLVTRLPATQAALSRVLREIKGVDIASYLDIGAGPGGSWEIIKSHFASLQEATFVELDREFIKIGKERLKDNPIIWKNEAASMLDVKQHDLVLLSYAWGEMGELPILNQAWQAAGKYLVIIEPGTPKGYSSILEARDELIRRGAFIVAPCPHHNRCPWQGSSEWCHFGVRLDRSREHQWMKEGTLGFEDEKFSYIIFSKTAVPSFYGRMVKNCLRRKGHTILTLCSDKGIELKIVTKSDNDYKLINKLKWGDKLINNI